MVILQDCGSPHTSPGPRRRKIRSRGVTALQATLHPPQDAFACLSAGWQHPPARELQSIFPCVLGRDLVTTQMGRSPALSSQARGLHWQERTRAALQGSVTSPCLPQPLARITSLDLPRQLIWGICISGQIILRAEPPPSVGSWCLQGSALSPAALGK